MIRDAVISDIPDVVNAHLEAFPGFFLTKLGPPFLTDFYKYFISNKAGTLLVMESDGHVIGFAAYTDEPDKFFAEMKRERGVSLLIKMLPALLKSPLLVLKKIFRAIRYRGDKVSSIHNAALLSSIGVLPTSNGKGTGSKLLDVMESRLIGDGKVSSVYLTTDQHKNDPIIGFYKKNGYVEHSSFTQSDNRAMLRLIKPLTKRL